MPKMVTLKIDDVTITVPDGMSVVDAAKQAGIDIPVFCYHPKLEPVGMCRQCLVEVGRPMIDRASGKPAFEAEGRRFDVGGLYGGARTRGPGRLKTYSTGFLVPHSLGR